MFNGGESCKKGREAESEKQLGNPQGLMGFAAGRLPVCAPLTHWNRQRLYGGIKESCHFGSKCTF